MSNQNALQRYYRFHAQIYGLTRWAFLFGRKAAILKLKIPPNDAYTMLEVGCGTGSNLAFAALEHPSMVLRGVDISEAMLVKAKENTRHFPNDIALTYASYTDEAFVLDVKPDIVLFSYVLTMMNPGYEAALLRAKKDLPSGGLVAIVDFHTSSSRLFRWWMGKNHVRMEGQVLAFAQEHFLEGRMSIEKAYWGLWKYFIYIGIRK